MGAQVQCIHWLAIAKRMVNLKVFLKFQIIVDKWPINWSKRDGSFNFIDPGIKLGRKAFRISRESWDAVKHFTEEKLKEPHLKLSCHKLGGTGSESMRFYCSFTTWGWEPWGLGVVPLTTWLNPAKGETLHSSPRALLAICLLGRDLLNTQTC